MAIRSRSSEDHLHTNVILGKITEYDIFTYYCPSFKTLGKKFRSELRKDNTPSASIVMWRNNLLYKDFGYPDHTFNCFGYIQFKYNVSFIQSLKIIDCDFNLNLSNKTEENLFTMGYLGYSQIQPKFIEKQTIIQKKHRPWNRKDANFWGKYLVSKKILSMFAVEPISHFWINGTRFTCKSITYVFKFKNRYKIYSPYEVKNKWLSNTKKTDIQGYNQLPDKGERLLITSSLKDVMCLHAAGYNAIAMQSEMQIPEENLISELKKRFTTVDVLYDNDFNKVNNPGQTMAKKICDLYGLNNICLPETLESKDPSDLVKKVGSFNELKNILNDKR